VTGTGIEVSFLGAPARMPSGPARLAAMTGALLLPVCPRFTRGGWALDFGEPVPVPGRSDVAKATQVLADELGTLVTRDPSDWHVLQPIWRDG
jgi:phosphatidylinositol dimannoside acyltransferase